MNASDTSESEDDFEVVPDAETHIDQCDKGLSELSAVSRLLQEKRDEGMYLL